ncbi:MULTISPECIES: nucleoside-diphosphate kinase [Bacillus cereus group]|uniref:nucleoside-diphosphate kinase n=1 Tax=Bacillus cereus group TaxID=86661 RepID=UPI001F58840A|nr:nucleoside-diphosphate kinase [Bacillus pacificus]MED0823861.1 nucleoside-diphosphate kinase [Bacillus pacificus]
MFKNINTHEYALLVLKPDGVQRELLERILLILENHGLKEVKRNSLQLTPLDVKNIFIHSHQEFLNYMSRGPITAVLLYGHNAFHKLRVLKPLIREYLGGEDVENILHSSEAGNEYDLQVKACFPEMFVNNFNLFGDMYVKEQLPENKIEFVQKVNHIFSNCHSNALALVLPNDNFLMLQDYLLEYSEENKGESPFLCLGAEYYTNLRGYDFKLLGYYPLENRLKGIKNHQNVFYEDVDKLIDMIVESNGVPFLSPTNHLFDYNEEYFIELKEKGLEGGVVYHPRYSLKETDFLREQIKGRGLTMSGGSGGVSSVGRFGVSLEIFSEVHEKLIPNHDLNLEWVDSKLVIL